MLSRAAVGSRIVGRPYALPYARFVPKIVNHIAFGCIPTAAPQDTTGMTTSVYEGNIHSVTRLAAATGFDWDAGNQGKNARHGVLDAETEQVFFSQPLLVVEDVAHSLDESRFHALGTTAAGRGLHVTFTLRADGTKIRVISARDMNRKERLLYERTTEEGPKVPH